jgi:hypothetical protein
VEPKNAGTLRSKERVHETKILHNHAKFRNIGHRRLGQTYTNCPKNFFFEKADFNGVGVSKVHKIIFPNP